MRLDALITIEQEDAHFVQSESSFATTDDDLLNIGSARIDF